MEDTYEAPQATSIRQASPNTPYPDPEILVLDGTGAAEVRVLLELDLLPPVGFDANVSAVYLQLFKAETWPAGAKSITAAPLNEDFDQDTATWTEQPATRTPTSTNAAVAGGGAEGDLIEIDITTMYANSVLADDNEATRWFGVKLTTTYAGALRLFSLFAEPDFTPKIRVVSQLPSEAPAELVPRDGRVVGVTKPVLMAHHTGNDDDAQVTGIHVQVDDVEDMVTPVIDIDIASSTPMLDLAKNLLTKDESDIEASLGSWTNNSNATTTRSTAQAQQGTASVSMVAASAAGMSSRTAIGAGGRPVVGGRTYTASAFARPAVTARQFRIGIRWYDAAGTIIGTTNFGPGTMEVLGAWTRDSLTIQAPANAAFATLVPYYLDALANGEQHFVDAIMLEEASAVSTFQPGVDAMTAGQIRYWRMMTANNGVWTPWSDVESFEYRVKPVITITSPVLVGGEVDSPIIEINYTVANGPLEFLEVELLRRAEDDEPLLPYWTFEKQEVPALPIRLPEDYPIEDGYRHRLYVRGWDAYDREDSPGDLSFAEAVLDFTIASLVVA